MAQAAAPRRRESPGARQADQASPHRDGGSRASQRQRDAIASLRDYLLSGAAGRRIGFEEFGDTAPPGVVALARLHDGPEAQEILAGFGVPGLAIGRHVLLDRSLGAAEWMLLLRHELRHVAQTAGRDPDLDAMIDLGPPAGEPEIDAAAAAAAPMPAMPTGPVRSVASGDANTVRFGGYGDAMIRNWAKKQEEERKRAAWTASVEQRWHGDISAQARTLQGEIDRNRQTIFGLRTRVLAELAAKGALPESLKDRAAGAEVAVELLDSLLLADAVREADMLPEETATAIRGPLNGFYLAVLDLADERDATALAQWEQDQWTANLFDRERPQNQCKAQLCHAPPPRVDYSLMVSGLRRPRPAPTAPLLVPRHARVDPAVRIADWEQVVKDYRLTARMLDQILITMLPISTDADRKVLEAYQYSLTQVDRLEALKSRMPKAQRIRAVFYPRDKMVTDPEDPARQLQIAEGIPWQFYLSIKGRQWVLEDFTAPKPRGPFYAPATQEDIDAFEALKPGEIGKRDPPTDLFKQLNHAELFPYGRLYWEMPSGQGWYQPMTEPWTWSQILTGIGLTLGALALIIGSAGILAPGVIAASTAAAWATGLGLAATAFSLGGTALEWQEKEKLGILTEAQKDRMILSIVTDIASALTLGLGSVVRAAGQAGRIGSWAAQGTRAWFLIKRGSDISKGISLATNVATAGVATYDLINAYKAIQSQPGLTDEERTEALKRLVMTGLLTGTLMTIAIRSDVKDITAGARAAIHVEPDGTTVLRPDVEAPHGRPGEPPPKAADVEADLAGRAAGSELGFAPPRIKPGDVPVVENPTLKHEVEIKLHRGQDGHVDAMSVEYRPETMSLRPDLIDLHLEVVRKFTGIRGRITELLEKLRALFTGTEVPPLHLQMELYKHRLAASRVAETLQKRGPSLGVMEADALIAELDSINRRIGEIADAINDPSLRARYDPSVVAIQRKPADRPDLPDPPVGHTYYLRPDGVWDIRRMRGYADKVQALRVEYKDNKPTGRFTNAPAIEASGIIGAKLTERTKKILLGLGYQIDSAGRIRRPIGHADIGDMKALTVDEGGRIQLQTGVESLADQQKRLRTAMEDRHGSEPGRRFDALKQAEEAAGNKVVLVEGIHDTKVTWREILDPATQKAMRRELRAKGVPDAEITRLINGLRNQRGTVKVVLGTRGVRESHRYRSGQTGGGTTPAAGEPRHHGHPLYLGGSHDRNLLFDLDKNAHDAVHEFFEKSLKLPSKADPPGVLLEPAQLRDAVAAGARPGAAIVEPDGSVTLKYLDE